MHYLFLDSAYDFETKKGEGLNCTIMMHNGVKLELRTRKETDLNFENVEQSQLEGHENITAFQLQQADGHDVVHAQVLGVL